MVSFGVLEKIQQRIDSHSVWLKSESPLCFEQQKHCEEGTEERIYWHYGYMVALTDIRNLLLRNGNETENQNPAHGGAAQ